MPLIRLFSFLILALHLPFLPASPVKELPYREIEDQRTLPLLTPDFKEVTTKKILLKNGLQAYLISDPKIDKSGAGLSVEVGSWDDPDKHLGMAHFCEHMLFLGTEKYPLEKEYSTFINENGGSQNAATSSTSTYYMFSIRHGAFEEALDRFSQFFISPLFNESGVNREKTAIHNEFAKNYESDGWRQFSLLSRFTNPSHPGSRFTIGNLESLKNTSPDELRSWYEKHYSSEKMKLIIISPLPLEELATLTAQNFSAIPRRLTPKKQWPDHKISKDAYGKIVFTDPIRESRTLSLIWELPQSFSQELSFKPHQVVSHILGHEGKGSLLSQLKKEGLAESLQSGAHNFGNSYPLLYLDIGLTEKGLSQYQEVIKRTFQALKTYQSSPPPVHTLKEIQRITTLAYQYPQRRDVFDSMMLLASNLHKEPMATFPQKTFVLDKINPSKAQSYFRHLTLSNLHCQLKAKGLFEEYTQFTPYFKVPYHVQSFSLEFLQEIENLSSHPSITFPSENPLIPQNTEVLSTSPEKSKNLLPTPSLVQESEQGKHYYLQDKRFLIPEAQLKVNIISKYLDQGGVEENVAAELFDKYLHEHLVEFTYTAMLAGLYIEIAPSDTQGFTLLVGGYSDKLPEALKECLKLFKTLSLNPDRFEEYQQYLKLNYLNESQSNPYQQALHTLRKLLYSKYYTPDEKLEALEQISFEHVQRFAEQWLKEAYLQSLAYGNLSHEQTQKILDDLDRYLDAIPYPPEEHQAPKVLSLSKSLSPTLLATQTNMRGNALFLMLEGPEFSFANRAAQQVMNTYLQQPFFDTLRTKQQTSYMLHHWGSEKERLLHNYFMAYSNTHHARDLLSRFELFIEETLQEIHSKDTEKSFETVKSSLIKELSTPPQNMQDMFSNLFIFAFEYEDFQWVDKRLSALKSLTFPQWVDHCLLTLGKDNLKRLAILNHSLNPESYHLRYLPFEGEISKYGEYKSKKDHHQRDKVSKDKSS